jgi:hypothetical protein
MVGRIERQVCSWSARLFRSRGRALHRIRRSGCEAR